MAAARLAGGAVEFVGHLDLFEHRSLHLVEDVFECYERRSSSSSQCGRGWRRRDPWSTLMSSLVT